MQHHIPLPKPPNQWGRQVSLKNNLEKLLRLTRINFSLWYLIR